MWWQDTLSYAAENMIIVRAERCHLDLNPLLVKFEISDSDA